MSKPKFDKGVYQRTSVTVGGHSVSIEPESLQPFDHNGQLYLKAIKPFKKKPSPDAKKDDLVLWLNVDGELDLSVEQAKEVIGEYTISALCARAGDIASSIKFSGRIANMRVRMFDKTYDMDSVDFEKISIAIVRQYQVDAPSYWIVRLSFSFTFIPTVANSMAVFSEFIREDIPFSCMPANDSFSFDDEDWQEKNNATPATPQEPSSPETQEKNPADLLSE